MKWQTVLKAALVIALVTIALQWTLLIFLWVTGNYFGHWTLIWAIGFTLAVLISISLALFYRKSILPIDAASTEFRMLEKRVNQQFIKARSRALLKRRNPEAVLWNIFFARQTQIASTAMTELGYVIFGDSIKHSGLTITTWESPSSIAYKIEIEDGVESSFDSLDILFHRLNKSRPGLAVNSTYVEFELAMLFQAPAIQEQIVSKINRILNVASHKFGVDVPVHVLLVGLEKMCDVPQAALATGCLDRGVIFGGFLPEMDAAIEARVDALFEEVIVSLSSGQIAGLQKQFLPEFCVALLNAPLQLALLKAQLRKQIVTLVFPLPLRSEPLNLQSIVFVGASEGMPTVDPLAQVSGQRLLSQVLESVEVEGVTNSVTTGNAKLLTEAYLNEGFLVQPNLRQTARRRLTSSLWNFGIIACLCGYGFWITKDFRHYNTVNNSVKSTFDTYFTSVSSSSTDTDSLVQHTLLLQSLRESLALYRSPEAFNHRYVLPSWSMEEMFRSLYESELTNRYQASLIEFIEKEILAYDTVDDWAQIFHLATIEAQIHADQISHKEGLMAYYSIRFAEQGETSSAFQESLKQTLDDLFSLNQPPKRPNDNLRSNVVNKLRAVDTANLLYEVLMRSPKYNDLIDIRKLIGPRFSEVFVALEDPEDYKFPRAYSHSGFSDLFDEGEIPDLIEIIRKYEAVVGNLSNAEKNSIIKSVVTSYAEDYVKHWDRFLLSLKLREANSWSDAQILLTALTNTDDNPVDELANVILTNVGVQVPTPSILGGIESIDGARQDLDQTANPTTPHLSSGAAAAYEIRKAFQAYFDALQSGPDQSSQFDLFLGYTQDVNMWLSEASTSLDGTGAYLFEQFENPEAPNPLAVLNAFVARSELDLIQNFGRNLVMKLDASAMEFVQSYIDEEWNRQIRVPHQAALTSSFPFDPLSKVDFPLIDFTDLFGSDGKVQKFKHTFLSGFLRDNGQLSSRATFLPTGQIDLSSKAKKTFTRVSEISETMFVDGKPLLDFGVRTRYLDNELSGLNLSSGVNLHQFNHGPMRWDVQAWPLFGTQNSTITFSVLRGARAVIKKTYTGPWSWFRLFQDGDGSLHATQGVSETIFHTDFGAAKVQFDVAARISPFTTQFFQEISLPQSLFELEGPVADQKFIIQKPAEVILSSWRGGSPEITEHLIALQGSKLEFATRVEIQRLLAEAGYYKKGLDGIFGPATRDALWAWRRAGQKN